jgi:excisionase family DNA binding protein
VALPGIFTLTDEGTSEEERRRLQEIAQLIVHQATTAPKLVFAEGQEAQLPDLVYQLLRDAVRTLARGEAVSLIPLHQQLTTQQAADLLGVSRQYLVRLLDRGAIPFQRAGSHRRVIYADLLAYQRERKQERREALREITRLSEELGLYDR